MLRAASLLHLVCYCLALPTWEGLNSRGDFMSSIVPARTYIQVMGPPAIVKDINHLSSITPGEPGNLTFLPTAQLPSRSPSLFAVSRNQLFQYRNESTVYPVAVKNTTLVDGVPPLQLVLGKYNNGLVSGGNWHWKGTMLRYELGSNGNQGIFYTCPTEGGSSGIFMSLSPGPTPEGCHIITLHSFTAEHAN
ncbi:hypothetical protein GGX14DRAFT_509269 [Mycena pura]|uniref:Uncharacterized protein n=1 Tax=Mycena pura TaxID=153505 RepID=A0AAD6YTD3_9AGAR|nr:hypothetical protein GGX14DRAFT_509269 [Mycena pura]